MRKPASLRKALERAIPELRDEPDRLIIWVEDGTVRSTQTGDYNFTIEYPLSIVIDQAKTDISIIALAIIRWLQVEQPDLLMPRSESFKFETDFLDNKTADIGFTIELQEHFTVTENAGPEGGWTITATAEPDPAFDDEVAFATADPPPDLVGINLDDGNEAP